MKTNANCGYSPAGALATRPSLMAGPHGICSPIHEAGPLSKSPSDLLAVKQLNMNWVLPLLML